MGACTKLGEGSQYAVFGQTGIQRVDVSLTGFVGTIAVQILSDGDLGF